MPIPIEERYLSKDIPTDPLPLSPDHLFPNGLPNGVLFRSKKPHLTQAEWAVIESTGSVRIAVESAPNGGWYLDDVDKSEMAKINRILNEHPDDVARIQKRFDKLNERY